MPKNIAIKASLLRYYPGHIDSVINIPRRSQIRIVRFYERPATSRESFQRDEVLSRLGSSSFNIRKERDLNE